MVPSGEIGYAVPPITPISQCQSNTLAHKDGDGNLKGITSRIDLEN